MYVHLPVWGKYIYLFLFVSLCIGSAEEQIHDVFHETSTLPLSYTPPQNTLLSRRGRLRLSGAYRPQWLPKSLAPHIQTHTDGVGVQMHMTKWMFAVVWDSISLGNPGWPSTHRVAQGDPTILSPQPPKCWNYRCGPPYSADKMGDD